MEQSADPFTEKVYGLLVDKKITSVVDLGAGIGNNTLFFAEHNLNVLAVDRSGQFLEKLNKRAQKLNLSDRIITEQSDIRTFAFQNQPDCIFITYVLHFMAIDEAKAVVQKCLTALAPGGFLAIGCILQENTITRSDLEDLAKNCKIVFNQLELVHDAPHPGCPIPHDHEVAYTIAQKPDNAICRCQKTYLSCVNIM